MDVRVQAQAGSRWDAAAEAVAGAAPMHTRTAAMVAVAATVAAAATAAATVAARKVSKMEVLAPAAAGPATRQQTQSVAACELWSPCQVLPHATGRALTVTKSCRCSAPADDIPYLGVRNGHCKAIWLPLLSPCWSCELTTAECQLIILSTRRQRWFHNSRHEVCKHLDPGVWSLNCLNYN